MSSTGMQDVNYLVGSVVPYAGAITNGNPITYAGGAESFDQWWLPDGSSILIWNPAR